MIPDEIKTMEKMKEKINSNDIIHYLLGKKKLPTINLEEDNEMKTKIMTLLSFIVKNSKIG